jgi:ECF sigma factor
MSTPTWNQPRFTLPEAAEMLGISPRSAGRLWTYARAWLRREIEGAEDFGEKS